MMGKGCHEGWVEAKIMASAAQRSHRDRSPFGGGCGKPESDDRHSSYLANVSPNGNSG